MEKEQLRVLLISPIPPPVGGDSTWAYKYLEYSKANKLPVRHVNTSIIGQRAKTVDDSVYMFDEIKRCFRIWDEIFSETKKFHPSIVHMNTNCSPRGLLRDYISALIIHSFKKRLILHCRCNVEDQIGNSKIGIFLFKRLVHLSSKVIILNEKSQAYVDGLTNSDTIIIPNYIEDEYLLPSKNIRKHIKQAIFVGHIRKSKGIEELLEAAQMLPDIQFVLAGPVTNDFTTDDIMKQSAGNVVVKGSLPAHEIKKLLDEADVFVFPTYTEGFSNALLEAMARGLPVITTNVGANYSMIEKFGGRIIETKSSCAIVDALKSIEDYNIRLQMSKWNINKVKENYIIETVINNLRALYMEVCKNKSR